jgi:MFS family permease
MTDTAVEPPRALWLRIFLPFAFGYYLSYLLRNANAVLAPELTRELQLSSGDLGLLTSAYFLAFGGVQIPLGILLDRFGPRRVQSALLLVAALGACVFAMGQDIRTLAVGRGLIGLGVSACLMAGLKNFSQWYPVERQSALTGSIMVAGGLGAISASVPLEKLLPILGWRGVFIMLTIALLVAVAYTFFAASDREHGISKADLSEQWRGVAQVFTSRSFWRFGPLMAMFSGGSMAVQGLWIVPWYMNVDGVSREVAARNLFGMGVAALASYSCIALFATKLVRRGIAPPLLIGTLLAIAWGSLTAILAGAEPDFALWIVFAFCSTGTTLGYTSLATHFSPALFGRVSTAANLLAFIAAFVLQWGIGIAIDAFAAAGWSPGARFRGAFAVLAILQAMAWGWFVLEGRTARTVAAASAREL